MTETPKLSAQKITRIPSGSTSDKSSGSGAAFAEGRPRQQASSTQAASARSGAGMDRQITTKNSFLKKFALPLLAATVLLVFGYQLLPEKNQSYTVRGDRITTATVRTGNFEDFVPVSARVTPLRTVFLDAIEGGRVETIHAEDGATLKAGDLIVELSNSTLQLNILSNEARVAEQLNTMRTLELSLEQNQQQHKRNLIDIEHQIRLLTRQLKREEDLLTQGAVPKSRYEDTRDTLLWYKKQLDATLESQATDARLQTEQLAYLRETSARLEDNLKISRKNLESMNVRAPVDGSLSGFSAQIGQSVTQGERLGQIDTAEDYKLTSNIDEFYLSRVDLEQRATLDVSGEKYELKISKIYSAVTNGQFQVDLKFTDTQPKDIRRGQTVQTKLTLGDTAKAKLIPNGTFYQDTGGRWLFVVTQDGSQAIKRNVRLGRRNNQFIEVLGGLEEGERIVTSSYSSYRDIDVLNLAGD